MKDLKKFIGRKIVIKIDRPVGSKHPKYGFTYPINYGYFEGYKMPDGEDLDAYVLGTTKQSKEISGTCIAIIHRINDDDDKLVVSVNGKNFSNQEIEKIILFQEKYFQHEIWQ